MKIKLVVVLLVTTLLSGCASTSDKPVRDFLDGASAKAERRQKVEANSSSFKKRDYENEFVEDTMSGILTALFRGIFGSDDD
ncbi:MAG: hypothetical protein ACFHVJ_06910 [Aestuariibacter sp.]